MSENSCPNCNAPLKSGVFASNKLLEGGKVNVINFTSNKSESAYCNKCGNEPLEMGKMRLQQENMNITNSLRGLLSFMPMVTTHTPYNWKYTALGIVTGVSVTGTGVFSEFASSFSDFFGGQSKGYGSKIKGGEARCMEQLKGQAINLGGNAIIATDIDYSEVGTEKGMLMVCMAGTAVRLENLEVLDQYVVDNINKISPLVDRLNQLNHLLKGAEDVSL